MICYSATTIFRTANGPLAGFSFAPVFYEGEHTLREPVIILHDRQTVPIKKVFVHKAAHMILLNTMYGWTTATEEYGEPQVFAYSGLTRMIGKSRQKFSNAEVELMAFDAAAVLSGQGMSFINGMINSMSFYEVKNSPYTKEDFANLQRMPKLFTDYTEQQLALWLHDVIVFLHRMKCVKTVKSEVKDEKLVSMTVENVFYRDMFIFLLRCFGCKCLVKYRKDSTLIKTTASSLADLFGAISALKVKPLAANFALYRRFIPAEYVVLTENGQARFVRTVDTFHAACVERVEAQPTPVLARAISFPEMGDFYLENNLLRVSHAEESDAITADERAVG